MPDFVFYHCIFIYLVISYEDDGRTPVNIILKNRIKSYADRI